MRAAAGRGTKRRFPSRSVPLGSSRHQLPSSFQAVYVFSLAYGGHFQILTVQVSEIPIVRLEGIA